VLYAIGTFLFNLCSAVLPREPYRNFMQRVGGRRR